jgi:sarcosine oxidase subunit beta
LTIGRGYRNLNKVSKQKLVFPISLHLMPKYSALGLLTQGLVGHRGWPRLWGHQREPAARYDVLIVGAGGHGLATAYYLARQRAGRIGVLDAGWLGGGNTARNTTVLRSNYLYAPSGALYDLALSLYEGLAEELDFNVMVSQRGVLSLAHSRHELEVQRRWAGAIAMNGIDVEVLGRDQLAVEEPLLNLSSSARYPVLGGFIQRRGGVARHDAVAWGYARAASALGVDIVEQCAVSGIRCSQGRVTGVDTSRGPVDADQVVLCNAGGALALAASAGVHLPIELGTLQAFVTEPLKPCVRTVVLSASAHVYVSQSDKGELVAGGGTEPYPSLRSEGGFAVWQDVASALLELFPSLTPVRVLRQWGGVVDITPDRSALLGRVEGLGPSGLLLNCGWGTGGFKAIPAGGWLTAHDVLQGRAHEVAEPFSVHRFAAGALIDESAAASVAH